ncbi:MAG: succinate--CoA ligase subunit alpha [Micrococcales bacterium]|nr:succinate--CoA ligase subunit alpha [Micrococcales bacterium]
MAIFLTSASRVIVQGMTGSEGMKHTRRMLAAGTTIIGGVNPRKAGQRVAFPFPAHDGGTGVGTVAKTPGKSGVSHDGGPGGERTIPVFGTVAEAMGETGADVTAVFVPPRFAKDAVIEAIDAGIGLVVVITEGIPVADAVDCVAHARQSATRIIGPNCPGIISPGQSNVGITPADITGPGPIGLVSKSGTLTYQMMHELRDLGFSTCIGIGGDPIVGTTHIDALAAFEADPDTEAVVMIGEIGGDAEERAAAFIADHITKPVVAYVAGFTAPEGKTMGHAGAIISGSAGSAAAKAEALRAAGVPVGTTPSETASLLRSLLHS